MTDEQEIFQRLEEQLQERAPRAALTLVARLHDFGVADRLLPITAVTSTLEVPAPRGMTKRYVFRGTTSDGHMYAEEWMRAFGTEPTLCGHGMVAVSYADFDLTGGAL